MTYSDLEKFNAKHSAKWKNLFDGCVYDKHDDLNFKGFKAKDLLSKLYHKGYLIGDSDILDNLQRLMRRYGIPTIVKAKLDGWHLLLSM